MRPVEIEVMQSKNCPAYSAAFVALGPTWTGAQIVLPFGLWEECRLLAVVGRDVTTSGGSRPAQVHCTLVVYKNLTPRYLVRGGTAGVRILSDEADADEHGQPRGYGRACIWLDVDQADDLPGDVLEVVGRFETDTK